MVAVEVTEKFADSLNEKFGGKGAKFSVMAGRKFDRIVIERAPTYLPIAHAFVERETGKLFKAGGWAGPAKNARFDLSTPEGFSHAIEQADIYGGYLYPDSAN